MQESQIDNWAKRYGIVEQESEYHANTDHLGSTDARMFLRCPAKYRSKAAFDLDREDSAAMFLGRAAHKIILEGSESFTAEYTVGDGPINKATGKPYKRDSQKYAAWAAVQPHQIISVEEFGKITSMSESVMGHAIAPDLLSTGDPEMVFRGGEYPQCPPIQARVDWSTTTDRGATIVDLKTVRDLDRMDYEIKDRQYAFQLAWYRKAIELASDGNVWPTAAYIIAVETAAPFRCGVWDMTINMDRCADEVGLCLSRYLDCVESRKWPSRYDNEMMYHTP